jgi:hypothetical protein
MATTFDVNRIGGGTFELVQDPATGKYTVKQVGFTPVKKLSIPDYTTATTTAGTTDTSKATTEATTQTVAQQTTEAFKPTGGGDRIDYTGSEMLSQAQLQKEAKKIDPQVDTTTTSLGIARPTMRDIAGDTTQQTTKSEFERPTMRDIAGDITQSKAPGIVVDKTPISPFRSLSFGAQQVQAPQAYASTTADARAAMTSDAAQLGISKVAAQPLDTERFAGSTAGTLADPAEKEDVKPEAPTTGLSTVKTGLQTLASSVGKVLTSGPIATIAKSIAANIQESPTDKFNKSYFNVMDNGRIGGNPATDVFGGMNAVSAFGDVAKGARSRIATRKNTIATKNVSQEFIDKTKEMEKQLEEYNNEKNKEVADRAKAKEENKEVYGGRKESTGKDSFGQQTAEEASYGSCFIAGTKITMADGTTKNIEDIIVGDKVKGYKGDNEVIKLDPTLLGERKLYSFNNTEHYFFTSEHPFMTDKGWKSIKPEKTKERDGIELYNQLKGELKVGDKLITENALLEITDIKSKDIESPKTPLYNFNVSNDNSYIADKYVVHNKGGGDGCFLKGTLVTMLDGSKKEIEKIDLGDEVAIGGKVFATGKFLINNLFDYKGIKVSGSHMVNEEGNWTRVENSKYGKALGNNEHVVYVFGSENRRILIDDIVFTDYFEIKDQEELIKQKDNFFNNWKTHAINEDINNVNILNAN